jgi:Glycolipid 2-alpha-mannosyltransferase
MCDVEEDPFVFLQENNKVYGFTISMYEFKETIPTLWKTTMGKHCHPWYLLRLTTSQISSRKTLNISLQIMRWDFYPMMMGNHIIFVTVSVLDSFRLVFTLVRQSGVILRSPIWISGAQRHTQNTLTISIPKAGSIMRCTYHSAIQLCLTSSSALGRCTSTFTSGSTFRSERPDTHV